MYVRRYQYLEAQTMCENLMRAYPNTTAAEYAHFTLGTYMELGGAGAEKSVQAYESFIDQYPKSIYYRSAVSRLTSLLLQSGKAEKAEKLLMDRLGQSPNDSNLLDQLAEVYQQLGRAEDAIRLLETALERLPGDAEHSGIAGKRLRRQGRPRQGARGVAAHA